MKSLVIAGLLCLIPLPVLADGAAVSYSQVQGIPATTNQLGVVSPDGTTITNSNGMISIPRPTVGAIVKSGGPGVADTAATPNTDYVPPTGASDNLTIFQGRTLGSKFRDSINALDGFGMTSPAGLTVAQTTTALLAWVAAVNAQGSAEGELPCGDYYFNQTLVFTGSGQNIRGYGANCARLHYSGVGDAVRFSIVTPSNPSGSGGLNSWSDITLQRDTADTSTGIGLHVVNQSAFRYSHAPVHNFYRDVVTEGGTENLFHDLIARGGDQFSSAPPGSVSFDVQPFNYTDSGGNAHSACPNGVLADNVDLGGPSTVYTIEEGVRIGCGDQVNIESGHIGSTINDVALMRPGNLNIASVEVGSSVYLDGSQRAFYAPAPTSGTGGYTLHIRIHPYQVDNQYGNGVEIEDPTFDGAVFDTDFADQGATVNGVQASGTFSIYAPYAAKLAIQNNKFEGGNAAVGGVKVGLVTGVNGAPDTPGSVTAFTETGNQFYGISACLLNGSYPAIYESLIHSNQTHDCTSGLQPAEMFPSGVIAPSFTTPGGLSAPTSLTNGPWTAYTPTFSCANGTLTTAAASGRYQQLSNKTVNLSVSLKITTAGSCSGYILLSLPTNTVNAGSNSSPVARIMLRAL